MAKKRSARKPAKPYADYPLFAHAAGVWAKKIRGKLHYFGPWDDPDRALEKYLAQQDALHAGRTPRVDVDGLRVRELLNRFVTAKQHALDAKEIVQTTFNECFKTCERIGDAFGLDRLVDDLAADDFERFRAWMAKQWGPVRLGNEVQRVRSVFKYGYEAGLIDKPIRYGPAFKKPSAKTVRQARMSKPARMLEATEIKTVMAGASVPMKAMILLGINCGFGNGDVAALPQRAIRNGWVDFPRPKTAIKRRCPLWPETVEAIEMVLERRPNPREKGDKGLVFITKYGRSWARRKGCPVSQEFAKLLKAAKRNRTGVGFYSLRHAFETIGGDSRDQVAVSSIMGHVPENNDISAIYRQRVSDARLQAVVDYVHRWLFGKKEKKVATP